MKKSNQDSTQHGMTRRDILGAIFGTVCVMPIAVRAFDSTDSTENTLNKKRLIIYSLYGGNDGLNTVVPILDPLYKNYRPNLALPANTLLPINDELALHAELSFLHSAFEKGEVAIFQDVGYPYPNLSHFESRAIWDSAKPALGKRASTGWYGDLVTANRKEFDAANLDVAAISFLAADLFASGNGVSALNTSNIQGFLANEIVENKLPGDVPEALNYLAHQIKKNEIVRSRLLKRLRNADLPRWDAYQDSLQSQIKMVEYFLRNQVQVPALKIYQDGFDTHTGQMTEHSALLSKFDQSLKQLVSSLKSLGIWQDAAIWVYSEFGRRPHENGGGGTDHGTAGPAFLLGGSVRGGVYGQRADLGDLDENGNLKFTTDFRHIYSTLADRHFRLHKNPFADAGFAVMEGVFA